MDKVRMVQPQWIRFTHANGKFAFEFDALRGIARCVDRGGTITHDLAAEMAKAQADAQASDIDTAATNAQ